MSVYICLLLVAIIQGSSASSGALSCSSTCPDHGEVDFFRMYTSVDKQKELISMPLNEAPRIGSFEKLEPSFEFKGQHSLEDTGSKMLKSLICGMCSRHSFTFHASMFFVADDNGGPLLLLHHEMSTVFAVDVTSNGGLISVHYMHQRKVVTENFKTYFKPGTWYKIAVQFDGNQVKYFVDCKLVESRLVSIPDYCFNEGNFSMMVGKNLNGRQQYTGSLQSVRVLSTLTNPLVKQCPDISLEQVQCPVCGSQLIALKAYDAERNLNKELKSQLESATIDAQECSEKKTKELVKCVIDSVQYSHGEFAKTRNDEICFCQYGEAHCIDPSSISAAPLPTQAVVSSIAPSPSPMSAEEGVVYCPPVTVGSTSVKVALGKSEFTLKGGDTCVKTTCENPSFGLNNNMKSTACADVNDNCTALKTMSNDDQQLAICCMDCDACSFAICPENAVCKIRGSDYDCLCEEGYKKEDGGVTCHDINECDDGTHNCPVNASCSNTEGSFDCQCPQFYELERINSQWECVDIDECITNTHDCPDDTICVNKVNGFSCACREGYQLQDSICQPICDPECQFGECISPNNCSCFEGYKGSLCDEDVDECTNNKDLCVLRDLTNMVINISQCVNTFGGYFCTCNHGYQWVYDRYGSPKCSSVHECKTGIHNCPGNTTCRDRDVGFQCDCRRGNCRDGCVVFDNIFGEEYLGDGANKSFQCETCSCNKGEYSCVRDPCDCSDPNTDYVCCPQCARKDDFCFGKEELTLKVNDRHYDSADSCSYVECITQDNSLVITGPQTVTCDTLVCPAGKQYKPNGACCPVCSLPTCSMNSYSDGLSVNIHTEDEGCETCVCENDSWNCNACQSNCPSLDSCQPEFITFLSSTDDCPVCLSSYSDTVCSS